MTTSPAASRPTHLLLILIDDLGQRDLACYGSSFYETPHLDRLRAQGMLFTDAYAACPVCSPTRASILTGRYPARVGLTNYIPGNAFGRLMGVPYFHALPRNETTHAQLLAEAGYATYHVGKWHLGPMEDHGPERFGFEVNVGGKDHGAPPNGYFSPYKITTLPDGPDGEYLTDRLTDEANALIARHGPDGDRHGRPFLLNLCHYAVHTPIQAPADLVAKYEAKARALGLDRVNPIVEGEPFPCLHKKDKRVRRRVIQSHCAYAAMMENLDTNIGRTLAALDEHGLADDTLVLFTSDNGGLSTAEGSPTCNLPLSEGKGWMYEGGNRVCLLARWPGRVAANSACNEPVTSPDLFATLLDAADVTIPHVDEIDGVSLMPWLTGEAMAGVGVGAGAEPMAVTGNASHSKPSPPSGGRGPLFWHYPHYGNQGDAPACAVRHGRYKLIEHFEAAAGLPPLPDPAPGLPPGPASGSTPASAPGPAPGPAAAVAKPRYELFDLIDDPSERHNLAASMPGVRDGLVALLEDWKASVEAAIPQVNADYDAAMAGRSEVPDGAGRVGGRWVVEPWSPPGPEAPRRAPRGYAGFRGPIPGGDH